MSVTAFETDEKTGKATLSRDNYNAKFVNCIHGSGTCLDLSHSWYSYPSILAGFHSHYFQIPSELPGDIVIANKFEASDYYDTTDFTETFAVKILSNTAVTSCAVKGETYNSELIYYTHDSKFFDQVGNFKCFESENAAIKAGYKKSFR